MEKEKRIGLMDSKIHLDIPYNLEESYLWENLPRPRLLRVGARGDDAKVVYEPPKKRSLVIALGKHNQAVIAFPYGNTNLEGFHDHSEPWALERLGRLQTWTIMHGAIAREEINGHPERVLSIFKMPEKDRKTIENSDTGEFCHYDMGKVDPIAFLRGPDFLPQRLMQSLAAKRLQVVEGMASVSLYRLIKREEKLQNSSTKTMTQNQTYDVIADADEIARKQSTWQDFVADMNA